MTTQKLAWLVSTNVRCGPQLRVLADPKRAPQERLRAVRAISDLGCVDDATVDVLNAVVSEESAGDELVAMAGGLLGRLVFLRKEDPNFGARFLSRAAFDPYFDGYFEAAREAQD